MSVGAHQYERSEQDSTQTDIVPSYADPSFRCFCCIEYCTSELTFLVTPSSRKLLRRFPTGQSPTFKVMLAWMTRIYSGLSSLPCFGYKTPCVTRDKRWENRFNSGWLLPANEFKWLHLGIDVDNSDHCWRFNRFIMNYEGLWPLQATDKALFSLLVSRQSDVTGHTFPAARNELTSTWHCSFRIPREIRHFSGFKISDETWGCIV